MLAQMDNNEAAACLESVRKGDNGGYIKLLDRYDLLLFKFITKKAEGKINEYDLKDILQDTWCEVYEKNCGIDPNKWYKPEIASFYTYIANLAVIRLKKKKTELKGIIDIYNGSDEEQKIIIENIPDEDEKIPESIIIKKDSILFRLQVKMELLRIILLCGGYPHQQLAFLVTKFIHGKRSQRAVEGKITVVYDMFGEAILPKVYEYATKEIMNKEDIGEYGERIIKMMKPVEERFPYSIMQLTQKDRNRKYYSNIFNMLVEETCFKNYYQLSKDSNICKDRDQVSGTVSNWMEKVRRRICRLMDIPEGEHSTLFDREYESIPEISEKRCVDCIFKSIPPCENQL